MIYNTDCIEFMKTMDKDSVNLTITDIPYNGCSKESNGLRTLDKGKADVLTFDLRDFLNEIYRITKGTIIIFCGTNQISELFTFFNKYSLKKEGTTRQLIWSKTNPSPMNGKYVYLSGIENAIWFRKPKATFNAHCKSTVFSYPCGRSKLHPTEKNINLIKELILDNSNEKDIVFDPCFGSGCHLLAAKELNRKYIGCEIDTEYFNIGKKRLE